MTYAEILLSREWREKRLIILHRDKLKCQCCSNREILSNLQISQGLLISNSEVNNLCYLLFGHSTNSSSFSHRTKCFLKKDRTFWQDAIVREHILVYHENILSNIANPIAARRILKQEVTYLDSTPIVTNPIRNVDDANWIYNITLHVHHSYYKVGLNPWEYDDSALTTLCWSCHEKLHSTIKVPVMDKDDKLITSYTPCTRCHGAGEFPEYRHVENGICFECHGSRYYELMT